MSKWKSKKTKSYKPISLERFYKSDRWHNARRVVIIRDKGLCQMCGKPGTQVHHKIHLTIKNVDDPKIATNPNNLVLLCDHCHNEVHGRNGKPKPYSFDEEGNLVENKQSLQSPQADAFRKS